MEFLNEYLVPVIMLACLIVGYIVKKWVRDVDNRWIPTIVCILGAILAVLINLPDITLSHIVGGALSGLASTGLHQMFTEWIDAGGKTE